MNRNYDETMAILKRGVADIFPSEEFENKIKKSIETGKPLNVKLGVDPTASDIHLGFTVVMHKMRQFQDLGHQAILIIGDYTAMVGDPSGRDTTRPRLDHETIMTNAATYIDQACMILDRDKLKVVHNGDWFGKMDFNDVMQLASSMTVARMLEREDFMTRYKNQTPISLHEFFYPLMQGYDSVMIDADIELGGTDQRFNILVGRDLQKDADKEQQAALLMPILVGLDGSHKMSKSLGNYIGVTENPKDMFGKVMSIPDEMMKDYYELLTTRDMDEFQGWLDSNRHPKEIKKELAMTIVTAFHDAATAEKEAAEFDSVFSAGNLPEDMPKIKVSEDELWIVELVKRTNHCKSGGEIRRLIKGGGLKVNDVQIKDDNAQVKIKDGMIIKAGKRGFYKVTAG